MIRIAIGVSLLSVLFLPVMSGASPDFAGWPAIQWQSVKSETQAAQLTKRDAYIDCGDAEATTLAQVLRTEGLAGLRVELEKNEAISVFIAQTAKTIRHLEVLELASRKLAPEQQSAVLTAVSKLSQLKRLSLHLDGFDGRTVSIVVRELGSLEYLRVSESAAWSQDVFREIGSVPSLRHLYVAFDGSLAVEKLRACTANPELVSLALLAPTVDAKEMNLFFEVLAALPRLENLSISDQMASRLENRHLAMIAEISTLRRLALNECEMFDVDGYRTLRKLRNLRTFYARNSIWEGGIKEVAALEGLENVTLRGVFGKGEVLGHLAGLKTLRSLEFEAFNSSGTRLSGFIGAFKGHPRLEVLRGNWTPASVDDVKALASIPNLEAELALEEAATDEWLGELKGAPRLVKLEVTSEHVTDEGLKTLSSHEHLRELRIFKARYSDVAVSNFDELGHLEVLVLGGEPGITDSGIKSIIKLQNLRELDVAACENLTDAGLETIAKLANLRLLILGSLNSPFSKEAVAKLKKALPQCEIR